MQAAYQYPLIIGAVLIVIYLTAQYFKQGGIPQMLEYFKGGCQKKPKEIKIVTTSSFGQVNGAEKHFAFGFVSISGSRKRMRGFPLSTSNNRPRRTPAGLQVDKWGCDGCRLGARDGALPDAPKINIS